MTGAPKSKAKKSNAKDKRGHISASTRSSIRTKQRYDFFVFALSLHVVDDVFSKAHIHFSKSKQLS